MAISPVTISTLAGADLNSFLIKSSRNVAKIFVASLLTPNGVFFFPSVVLDVGTFHLKQSGW